MTESLPQQDQQDQPTVSELERRPWVAPSVRRMSPGDAETGPGTGPDGLNQS